MGTCEGYTNLEGEIVDGIYGRALLLNDLCTWLLVVEEGYTPSWYYVYPPRGYR